MVMKTGRIRKSNALKVCPAPLPARAGERDTFFDSVLTAHEYLEQPKTIAEFLFHMLQWARRSDGKSTRYLQNVLDAYYMIGLIPRISLPNEFSRRIISELPKSKAPISLRRHCLNCMTSRLAKMSEFWRALMYHSPVTTRELRKELACQALSLDDVKRRLRIMRNLGAVKRRGNAHVLTQLGYELAADYSHSKVETSKSDLASEILLDPVNDEIDTFGAIIFLDD